MIMSVDPWRWRRLVQIPSIPIPPFILCICLDSFSPWVVEGEGHRDFSCCFVLAPANPRPKYTKSPLKGMSQMVRRGVRSFSSDGVDGSKGLLGERRKSLESNNGQKKPSVVVENNHHGRKRSSTISPNHSPPHNNKTTNGEESNHSEGSAFKPKKKRRTIRSELDRLLMDEGTVNMLCERKGSTEPSSKEDKLEALKLRRMEVLHRVQRTSSTTLHKKALREKKVVEKKEVKGKKEEEWDYEGGIIRRHSSDFSSRDGSPTRAFEIPTPLPGRKKVKNRPSLLASMKSDRLIVCDPEKNIMTINKKRADEPLLKTPYEAYLAATKEPLKARVSRNFRDVLVRKGDGVGHVVLTGGSSVHPYSLSPLSLHELVTVLGGMSRDPEVKVVLLSSSGKEFCTGLDLSYLISPDPSLRQKAAEEMTSTLKEFVSVLGHYSKPLIASVHGDAVGLGVTMLPLFDLVYASDKATFRTPYARLAQIPEGIASLTFPQIVGGTITNAMIYAGKNLTATEALSCGLVTEVLWPARFQEELNVRVRTVASQSSQAMESTKSLLRGGLRSRVDVALTAECRLLLSQWCSNEFQMAATQLLSQYK